MTATSRRSFAVSSITHGSQKVCGGSIGSLQRPFVQVARFALVLIENCEPETFYAREMAVITERGTLNGTGPHRIARLPDV
jgi:hypothetical protein